MAAIKFRNQERVVDVTPQTSQATLPPISPYNSLMVASRPDGSSRVVNSPSEVNYDEIVENIPVAVKG